MTVAVNQPGSGDSIYNDIVKGLNIASTIMGIKANRAEVERLGQEREKKLAQEQKEQAMATHKLKGNYTPGEVKALQITKDMDILDKPAAGAVEIGIYDPENISGPIRQAWLKERIKPKEQKPGMTTEEKRTQVFQNIQKIQGDVDKDPEIRAARETLSAFQRVKDSVKKDDAASDMSLVYAYVKMMDPGTGVKEGEYNTIENARGYSDSLLGFLERVNSGKRLTTEQRKQFFQSAVDLAEGAITRANEVAEGFKAAAEYGDVPWKTIRFVQPPKGIEDVRKLFDEQKGGGIAGTGADQSLSPAEAQDYAKRRLQQLQQQQTPTGISIPPPAMGIRK